MHIRIDLATQTLDLHGDDGALIRRYAVSTAKNDVSGIEGTTAVVV